MAKLYVAYGSNLNHYQMRGRCPGSEFVGTGVVENHELQFKGSLHGAHATIAPKEGSSVPVGVWRIQERDESRLDLYEGYNPKGYCYYNKEQIPVEIQQLCRRLRCLRQGAVANAEGSTIYPQSVHLPR